jgi:hypothetical protein
MNYEKKMVPNLRERFKQIGDGNHDRVRMYGEELELTSDPVESESGYVVEGISRRSDKSRKVTLPLTVVQMAAGPGRH